MSYWTSGCDCGADACTCAKRRERRARRPKPVIPPKTVFEVYRSMSMNATDTDGTSPLHMLIVRGYLSHIAPGDYVRVEKVDIPDA